ncbi:hypothetical protein PAEPH01_1520 [Pancytospora epiphaga]|nr:hypothetical protein PAEPH01_1520 [Pancytospora epiphaga]
MEDEEKLLMERESEIYELRISKVHMRAAMHKIKNLGYESIRKADIPIIKIFIGYISQLGLLQHGEILDALSVSIAGSIVRPAIELILKNKLISFEGVLRALKGEL